jgi:hypothetical protein
MRIAGRLLLGLLLIYAAFLGTVYYWMTQPPEQFARHMASLPGPLFLALPFPVLWNSARAGTLVPGDPAPDFHLTSLDRSSTVRLSQFRGQKPVVLIFGSYT